MNTFLGVYNASTWRTKGTATTSQILFVVNNPTESGVIVSIRWLEIISESSISLTSIYPIANFSRGTYTSGGTILEASPISTNNPSAHGVCYGATENDDDEATAIVAVPGVLACRYSISEEFPYVFLNTINDLPKPPEQLRYTLNPGEAGIIQLVAVAAPPEMSFIVNATWEEWGV